MKARGRHLRRPPSHPQFLPLLPLGSLFPRSSRFRQTRPATCTNLWSRGGGGPSRGRRSASQPGAAGRRGAARGGAVQPAREPGTPRGRGPAAGPERQRRRLRRAGAASRCGAPGAFQPCGRRGWPRSCQAAAAAAAATPGKEPEEGGEAG